MNLNKVDARGLSCPEPVLMAKKALAANPLGLQIIVDNTTARENISRFAKNAGYNVDVTEANGDFLLTMVK